MKGRRSLRLFLLSLLFLLLLLRAAAVVEAAESSLTLCAVSLIPSLFPFSVCANLLIDTGIAALPGKRTGRLMRWLFGLPQACAIPLMLGALGGYPLGAQTLSALYQNGSLRRCDAIRLSRFCNNAGPAFLLGAVGLSLFHSVELGLLLWLVHLLSALCVGAAPSRAAVQRDDQTAPAPAALSLTRALPGSVRRSAMTMLTVCGFVVFFGVLTGLLRELPFFAALPTPLSAALSGALEMTNGLFALAEVPMGLRFVLASVLLAWGGLCVHFQSMTALQDAGLPVRPYLTGKALQALLALPLSAAAAELAGLPGRILLPLPALTLPAAVVFSVFLVFFLQNAGKPRKGLL